MPCGLVGPSYNSDMVTIELSRTEAEWVIKVLEEANDKYSHEIANDIREFVGWIRQEDDPDYKPPKQ